MESVAYNLSKTHIFYLQCIFIDSFLPALFCVFKVKFQMSLKLVGMFGTDITKNVAWSHKKVKANLAKISPAIWLCSLQFESNTYVLYTSWFHKLIPARTLPLKPNFRVCLKQVRTCITFIAEEIALSHRNVNMNLAKSCSI